MVEAAEFNLPHTLETAPSTNELSAPKAELDRLRPLTEVSAYIGHGTNRWPAIHVLDAARLYRLALEKREVGSRYNAVAEEGIPVRDIAESIGRGLQVPVVSLTAEEAGSHLGWLALFAGTNLPASSALTCERTGWQPTGPALLADLERMKYALA